MNAENVAEQMLDTTARAIVPGVTNASITKTYLAPRCPHDGPSGQMRALNATEPTDRMNHGESAILAAKHVTGLQTAAKRQSVDISQAKKVNQCDEHALIAINAANKAGESRDVALAGQEKHNMTSM